MPRSRFSDPSAFTTRPEESLRSYGPAELELQAEVEQETFWTSPPPEGFLGGATSQTEWMVYKALAILCPRNGCRFQFQESYLGGRFRPGGAVADFVVYFPRDTYIIRVQTSYWHIEADEATHAYDALQKRNLEIGYGGAVTVIDVFEFHFAHDPTGRAVLRVIQDALNGIEWPNPLGTGLAFPS